MSVSTGATEPMVVAVPDLLLPDGRRFWVDDAMFQRDRKGLPTPHFSVQEVSKVFFGNGPDWLRWRMRPDDRKVKDPITGEALRDEDGNYIWEKGDHPDGYFVLDGERIEPKRTDAGARYFTLADIERMAHALAQGGHIDGAQLTRIVTMVKTCAQIYGVLK